MEGQMYREWLRPCLLLVATAGISVSAAEPDMKALLHRLADNDALLERVMSSEVEFTMTEERAENSGSGELLHQAVRTVHKSHLPIKAGKSALPFANPFADSAQSKYTYQFLNTANGGAQARIHFEPRFDDASGLAIGDAVVDLGSGSLVEISLVPSKHSALTPRFELHAAFGTTPYGPVLSQMTSKSDSGFLFMRKHRTVKVQFSDFSRRDRWGVDRHPNFAQVATPLKKA